VSIHVFIATSLDGFIATRDGGVDWLDEIPNPEHSDFGYRDFMSGIDALVMGRNTFEKVLTLGDWPYDKPVFVLSKTLSDVPAEVAGKAEIVDDFPKSLTERLDQRGFLNLYVDGGKVIQSFLEDDLVDEMIITRVSVLLGDGIPLFGKLTKRLQFSHVKTETLNEILTQSTYTRVRK
jgi:dihydrofolate reductase